MMTHVIANGLLQNQWTPQRYRRLLILATFAPVLAAGGFRQLELQRWSWPTSAIAGVGLASLVLVHAKSTNDAHRRLWTILALLPIAFWTLAMMLTVGTWFD